MGALKQETDLTNSIDQYFSSSSYNIDQPFFEFLQEGYKISNPEGVVEFSAVRKKDFIKTIGARIGAIAIAFSITGVLSWGIILLGASWRDEHPLIAGFSILFTLFGSWLFFGKLLTPKRVTTLYLGEEENDKKVVFKIMPASGVFFFNKEFSLIFEETEKLTFKRPFINSILRTKWEVFDEQNNLIFTAHEDSWFKSILRRFFNLARLIPMHFVLKTNDQQTFCEFKRKFSIKDKYQMINKENSQVKPWMALATCILLDTGEGR